MSSTPSTPAEPRAAALIFAFCVGAAALLACAWQRWFTCDDAFISFRYARHLVEGSGLVFNTGEMPPVEGYSNFAWVAWIAACIRLGLDPARAANATSIASALALLYLVTRWAVVRFQLDGFRALLVALFLARFPSVEVWSTSGLETMPFTLCVFGLFERLTLDPARPRLAGACLYAFLATLLRADGAAWASLAVVAAWIASPDRGSASRGLGRAMIAVGAVVATTLAAHVGWRLLYYGEFLPNTAAVKAGASSLRFERGAKYVATFLGTLPGFAAVFAWGVAYRGATRRVAVAAGAVALVACAYALWIGGDFMPLGRVLVPAVPFAALAFAAALVHASRRVAIVGGAVLLALSASVDLDRAPLPDAWREALHFRWNEPRAKSEIEAWRGMRDRAREWRTLGRALAAATRPGESIVLGNIGAIGYETELVILDVFGLTDRDVAHRDAPELRASPGHDKAVSVESFFPRRPDFLGAWLAPEIPAGTNPDSIDLGLGLPAPLLALVRGGEARVERRTLPPTEGVPAGLELRLVRFVPRR